MVEEKVGIEIEIYELCKEIDKVNKSNLKKLKKNVSEEKAIYITNKIQKFRKYINNSELSFELSTTKNLIKEKLNAILVAEQSIENILNTSNNTTEIENKINIIINSIKELEPNINSLMDITIYMPREGIKNNIQLYKRELNRLSNEIGELIENTKENFRIIKENDDDELEEINAKHEDAKSNIEKQLNEFNAKITEMQNNITQKNVELNEIKENYNQELSDIKATYESKILELETVANKDFDKLKEDISKKDEKISELIGIIGNKANVGEYKTNADKAHTERIRWQIATVVIFGIAFVMMGLITLLTKDYNITTLARYIVSVILLGMSGYTAKQAGNQRKDEIYFRKQQLELASIDIYLDDMPNDVKIEIKKELSNKIFGQASETYKNKYDDNTNETIDKISKIIENMANVVTKK